MLITLGVYEKIWGSETLGIDKALLISLVGFLVVFVILAVLAVFVKGMGMGFDAALGKKKPDEKPAKPAKAEKPAKAAKPTKPAKHPAPVKTPPAAVKKASAPVVYTGTALKGVTEEEAAVIMALTSHKTGIPLERLAFNSIVNLENPTGEPLLTNVSEEEAAVIMALTADKLKKPLNKLRFNSIKLTEEI